MGSYHSYVGDAKLEDSKDNWYRISGMNISRWNLTTWGNVGRSLWDYAPGGGFVLAKAGRGLAGKSHWSDLLYKALKQDDALTLPRGVSTATSVTDGFIRFIWTSGDNNMDSLDITGNSFDFKNRLTKTEGVVDSLMLNCTTPEGGLYGKAASVFFSMYNIESTLHTNNYYFRDTPIEPDRNGCCFRPMLTLKPKGGEVLERFTLKIKITRRFTTPNGSRMYRLAFIPEIIEGNPSIIKEAIYKFGIGRNGEVLPDGTYGLTKTAAQAQEQALLPGEVTSHEAPHGAQNAAGAVGALYKLINGKCLYIQTLMSLPGMEQPWPDNGGIATSIVTFTEADAYTI